VSISLTSESASAPVALIDGDQTLIVALRVEEDAAVEGGMVSAVVGRMGKRAEYRCAACGYGIVVYGQPASCPMCREPRWEHVEWRPFSQLLDFPLPPAASGVASMRLRSPTAEEPIRSLRPGQAGAALEK
jgi:hypothetical protein